MAIPSIKVGDKLKVKRICPVRNRLADFSGTVECVAANGEFKLRLSEKTFIWCHDMQCVSIEKDEQMEEKTGL